MINQTNSAYATIQDERLDFTPDKQSTNNNQHDWLQIKDQTAVSSKLLINQALHQFNSHGLSDLHDAKLMNRVDSKFILPISFLPELLSQLTDTYSALEINNKRISSYHNQYFDTANMAMYLDHHNGKLNRYKVRQRHYVDTDTKYLEVKFKNNQARTIKSRIRVSDNQNELNVNSDFVHQKTGTPLSDLTMYQQSGYQRIALANEAQAERLTIDTNLWYQKSDGEQKISLPAFFIAELKQHKKSKRSPFYQLMSANNIFPVSFSKYCIGCALLYKSSIKTNRFKHILSRIEKLNQNQSHTIFKSK